MTAASPFTGKDYACALAAVFIWGTNFVVMKMGLQTLSPMLLGALRYLFATLLFLPFVRMPAMPLKYMAASGLLAFGQFALLFIGLQVGMTAGMASLLIQTQAMFTIVLAALMLGEHARGYQWVGIGVSAAGLAVFALVQEAGVDGVTIAGLLLTLGAALMWAGANLVARFAMRASPGYDPLGFIIYSSLMPILPFFGLAVAADGVDGVGRMLVDISWEAALGCAYLGVFATVVAYTLWTRLLTRHAAGRVAPYSLIVPLVGLYAASLVYDERMSATQWAGAALVLAGLLINQFGGRILRRS